MLGCRRYNRRLRFGLPLRQCHGVHGLLVFAFGLLLGMLGQRIREQVTGYGRLIVFRHWLRDIQRAKFKLVDLASNIIRAEDGGRLAGPQIKNIVDGHIRRIRLLRCFVNRIAKQIRHLKVEWLCHWIVDTNEVRRHITELHAHGRRGQQELDIGRQAQQITIFPHHIRSIGRSKITDRGRAIAFYREHGVPFGHRFGLIGDVKAGVAIIGKGA